MIKFNNGHNFDYVVASGALAFDGMGWPWEKPLIKAGLIRPELFTVVIKTLTLHPRKGNLQWWNPLTWLPFSPWSCVRFLPGGVVNKVGLTNPGIDWWCDTVAPRINFHKYSVAGSIFGNEAELVEMTWKLNQFNLIALEVNCSCPNTGHPLESAEKVVHEVKAVKHASRFPIIAKVSVDQPYIDIAHGLHGIAQAVSLNSVPIKTVFPNGDVNPLELLERKVGGGGGGVSGKPAQVHNWKAVELLVKQGSLPVIAPSIMEFGDLQKVRALGADAVSFGAIHLFNPCKPTKIVRKDMKEKGQYV